MSIRPTTRSSFLNRNQFDVSTKYLRISPSPRGTSRVSHPPRQPFEPTNPTHPVLLAYFTYFRLVLILPSVSRLVFRVLAIGTRGSTCVNNTQKVEFTRFSCRGCWANYKQELVIFAYLLGTIGTCSSTWTNIQQVGLSVLCVGVGQHRQIIDDIAITKTSISEGITSVLMTDLRNSSRVLTSPHLTGRRCGTGNSRSRSIPARTSTPFRRCPRPPSGGGTRGRGC
jgi:hypothetical protein